MMKLVNNEIMLFLLLNSEVFNFIVLGLLFMSPFICVTSLFITIFYLKKTVKGLIKRIKKVKARIKKLWIKTKGEVRTFGEKIKSFLIKVILYVPNRRFFFKTVFAWSFICYALAGFIADYFIVKLFFWSVYLIICVKICVFFCKVSLKFTFIKILLIYLNFSLIYVYKKLLFIKNIIYRVYDYIDSIYFLFPIFKIKNIRMFFILIWCILCFLEQIDTIYHSIFELDNPEVSGFAALLDHIGRTTIPYLYGELLEWFYPEPPDRGV